MYLYTCLEIVIGIYIVTIKYIRSNTKTGYYNVLNWNGFLAQNSLNKFKVHVINYLQ